MNANDNKRTNNVNGRTNTNNANASLTQSANKHKPIIGIIQDLRFNDEDGMPEVLLALRVNEETIDVNDQRSKISYIKIGELRYPYILEWVSAEGCMKYIRMEWAEVKVKATPHNSLLKLNGQPKEASRRRRARRKVLCKKGQASVKGKGANQGAALSGQGPA